MTLQVEVIVDGIELKIAARLFYQVHLN